MIKKLAFFVNKESDAAALSKFNKDSVVADTFHCHLNPDSKKIGVPRLFSGNPFSSRSEITGGLSSSLPSTPAPSQCDNSHLFEDYLILPKTKHIPVAQKIKM